MVSLFNALLFVDLADHFEDGDERGAGIAAEEGVLVGVGDDDGDVVADGLLVADPFFGRGIELFGDASLEADTGEGEFVVVPLEGHGL